MGMYNYNIRISVIDFFFNSKGGVMADVSINSQNIKVTES